MRLYFTVFTAYWFPVSLKKKGMLNLYWRYYWYFLLLPLFAGYWKKNFQSVLAAANPIVINRKNILWVIVFSEFLVASFSSVLRIAVSSYEAKRQVNELQQAHLETELRFLKSQLNPHFLFNTINNLYALALEKSDKTPDALLKMSSLLRYFLYECTKDKVPVEKEWEALLSYQDLFRLRHESVLNVTLSNHITSKGMIEPMILIPLLENCYKHSGIDLEPSAFIEVQIEQVNDFLQANFTNSIFNNIPKDNEKSTGIGLAAIQKRLALHYPGITTINITKNETNFHVHLLIPLS
jgi:two-component system, LytTR family, sensor kinase